MVAVRAERKGEGWECEVSVNHKGEYTRHTVAVAVADLKRWGRGDRAEDVEDFVRRSFDFLLQREPAGSILRHLDLSVIPRYFPEYDEQFKR